MRDWVLLDGGWQKGGVRRKHQTTVLTRSRWLLLYWRYADGLIDTCKRPDIALYWKYCTTTTFDREGGCSRPGLFSERTCGTWMRDEIGGTRKERDRREVSL
jgi:hypothetical protein